MTRKNQIQKSGSALLFLAVLALATVSSFEARADFADNHPRRAQVNRREARQNQRLDAGVADGQISATEQTKIATEEANIKAEEKSEAAANGGTLTTSQQQALNSELNSVSQEIYEDRH